MAKIHGQSPLGSGEYSIFIRICTYSSLYPAEASPFEAWTLDGLCYLTEERVYFTLCSGSTSESMYSSSRSSMSTLCLIHSVDSTNRLAFCMEFVSVSIQCFR